MTIETFVALPICDAMQVVFDSFGSPVMQESGPCGSKATLFYLHGEIIFCRCNMHALSALELPGLRQLSWDEYWVARVMVS
jgi:hypothetical protein